MKKIGFSKMVASGNDFVVVISLSRYLVISLKKLAREICDRKFGVGADGLLVLEKSGIADVKMRIFNADGSEAEMCGNGARCTALYLGRTSHVARRTFKIETKAGIIESEVRNDFVRIKLTAPRGLKLDIPIKINNRPLRVNFIDTGVPHTVIFVEGLAKIDVAILGRQIRNHPKFRPAGTNVNFVEILSSNAIKIRTYERGVEDETFACGTGSVAAALITDYRLPITQQCTPAHPIGQGVTDYRMINVHTESGEVLKVYFDKVNDKYTNIWLEGKARIVYAGVYNV